MSKYVRDDRCFICRQSSDNSRQLPCNHVLCFHCVQDIVTEQGGRRNNLECPACRACFAIPSAIKGSTEQPKYVKEKYKATIAMIPDATLSHTSKVMGMAVMDEKLYVVCKSPPNIILEYDTSVEPNYSDVAVELHVPDMAWPRGMAANESLKSLYISDWSDMFGGRLWKYNRSVSPSRVATLDCQPFGVSVPSMTDNTVLVTCATPVKFWEKKGWIYVYRDLTEEFSLLRKVELQDLQIPRHAILTAASRYLVCHGWMSASEGVTSFQQDESGRLEKNAFYGSLSGGGKDEMEMNRPLSMTLDEDGLVLVVDYCNHRIQLLTEDLHLVRHLITKQDHGIKSPRHVCLFRKEGRMYVAQEDGKILVYDAFIK